ncbi:class I SAM-dependent methyltransferase [Bacillus benzoevorans]|uniref:Ubiquinone/menaquinone biosynthesis C-methylase UbiE n=1 Tax=Bacillus benzoevorans TaxID=1456 RepID=A0A7X0HUY7_9BACI|nr:class I SAM-dependent methyltransferase [Bacillus benzoevorans]MBB6447367.1 ubiquinone/menaquinone biosynthesis C-methylase UbiE [Bacillus benzoevorans]
MELIKSRFFTNNDEQNSECFFPLPAPWWSRPFEYHWAIQFTDKDQVVLDAATGICHPFKFAIADICKEVHACDLDMRILSKDKILKDVEVEFGSKQRNIIQKGKYFERIQFLRANLGSIPYMDEKFDRVFCISVLEHLDKETLINAFKEFKRILKPDGKIVVTFDYPIIDLNFLATIIEGLGLKFSGEIDVSLPKDALFTDLYQPRLYCFRAVIEKIKKTGNEVIEELRGNNYSSTKTS